MSYVLRDTRRPSVFTCSYMAELGGRTLVTLRRGQAAGGIISVSVGSVGAVGVVRAGGAQLAVQTGVICFIPGVIPPGPRLRGNLGVGDKVAGIREHRFGDDLALNKFIDRARLANLISSVIR